MFFLFNTETNICICGHVLIQEWNSPFQKLRVERVSGFVVFVFSLIIQERFFLFFFFFFAIKISTDIEYILRLHRAALNGKNLLLPKHAKQGILVK